MNPERRHRRRVIAIWLAAITAAHALMPAAAHSWHWAHATLASAYLPVVFAATVWFGRGGGLLCAAAASALYLAHLLLQWSRSDMLNPDQFLFPVIFLSSALLAGSVVEDARRKRWERDEVIRKERRTALRNGVAGLLAARDARDSGATRRVLRVAELGAAVGRRLGLPEERRELLRFAARLRDLDADLLLHLDDGDDLASIVRALQGRPDDSGRARGGVDAQIPLEARILRVVEEFLALTQESSGSPALTASEALAVLRESSGAGLDANCLAALGASLADPPAAGPA